jgi:glycerophosphoryl diester phosphodiesterase
MSSTSSFFGTAKPRVFAHRGFAVEAPENTFGSFSAAVALGVTHIETDVHASKDGVAVISHDSVLDRVASRPGNIADFTFADLQRMDLGGGHGFVSLEETLDAYPLTFFNIDVKSADAAIPAASAILNAGAVERVLVSSFSESRRRAALRLLPGVATSASGPVFAAALLAARAGLTPLLRRILDRIDAVQIPERALGISTTTPAMISQFHAAGVEVHVWTINEASDMARLLAARVDGIVTDRADVALDVIASIPGDHGQPSS